jgi:hypothetical protein
MTLAASAERHPRRLSRLRADDPHRSAGHRPGGNRAARDVCPGADGTTRLKGRIVVGGSALRVPSQRDAIGRTADGEGERSNERQRGGVHAGRRQRAGAAGGLFAAG